MVFTRTTLIRAALLGLSGLLFAAGAGAQGLKNWGDQIPGTARWKVLLEFDGQAVLDKETELVWEKTASTTAADWTTARAICAEKSIGNRRAWRLPSFFELASLVDNSHTNPALPAGHPFVGVNVGITYWSGTTNFNNGAQAWSMSFVDGTLFTETKTNSGEGVWCVRGGLAGPTIY